MRGGARTTAFWEQFTHIHNAYLTSFRRPGGEPTVYERCIDEKGLRFDSVESYGEAAADPVAAGALPTLPERYSAGEEAGTIETTSTPAGRHNFFSALWYLRYEDWERIRQTVLPLTVEGEPWRLTLRREAREPQAVPGGRVETWRIVCTLEREDGVPAAPPAGGGEDGRRSDYVTRHLITEEAVLTFWIACESARRPVAVKVELPKYTVRGKLREPYEDERLADNAQR